MSLTLVRRLHIDNRGPATLATFIDSVITENDAEEIKVALFELIHERGVRDLILNFQKVRVLCSSGIGKLLHLHHEMSKLKGKLVMYGFNEDLIQELTILQLHRKFIIRETLDEALEEFREF